MVIAVMAPASLWSADVSEIDSVMDNDPKLEMPAVRRIVSKAQTDLWKIALGQSELDLQYRAAMEVAKAHRLGVVNLDNLTEPLITRLDSHDVSPRVASACLIALIEFDCHSAAPAMFKRLLRGDRTGAALIEPALAHWNYLPMREVWLKRLNEPSKPEPSHLLLSIDAFGIVNEPAAVPALRNIAMDSDQRSDLRIGAALALSQYKFDSRDDDAKSLSADSPSSSLIDRLVGATLLKGCDAAKNSALFLEYACDRDPVVASLAWERIVECECEFAIHLAEQQLRNRHAEIRQHAAKVLFKVPSVERIELLAERLGDPHPVVRREVRKHLIELAAISKFDSSVRAAGMRSLSSEEWHAIEQATYLSVALDHKVASSRLIELLEYKRAEIKLAAAWGLRKLAVPETLPKVLERAMVAAEVLFNSPSTQPGIRDVDAQLCQLFQFFGQSKFKAAEILLRKFVPKTDRVLDAQSRIAAIWALGFFDSSESPSDLVPILIERLTDEGDIPPEGNDVKRMVSITLGRLRATEAVNPLRTYYESETSNPALRSACAWALEQITGEKVPVLNSREVELSNWSLTPIR